MSEDMKQKEAGGAFDIKSSGVEDIAMQALKSHTQETVSFHEVPTKGKVSKGFLSHNATIHIQNLLFISILLTS